MKKTIEDTIKEFDKEFGCTSSDGVRLPDSLDPDKKLKEKFIVFLIKALKTQEQEHQNKLEEEYKNGFNDCLKEQKLTGERWQHLYL